MAYFKNRSEHFTTNSEQLLMTARLDLTYYKSILDWTNNPNTNLQYYQNGQNTQNIQQLSNFQNLKISISNVQNSYRKIIKTPAGRNLVKPKSGRNLVKSTPENDLQNVKKIKNFEEFQNAKMIEKDVKKSFTLWLIFDTILLLMISYCICYAIPMFDVSKCFVFLQFCTYYPSLLYILNRK